MLQMLSFAVNFCKQSQAIGIVGKVFGSKYNVRKAYSKRWQDTRIIYKYVCNVCKPICKHSQAYIPFARQSQHLTFSPFAPFATIGSNSYGIGKHSQCICNKIVRRGRMMTEVEKISLSIHIFWANSLRILKIRIRYIR